MVPSGALVARFDGRKSSAMKAPVSVYRFDPPMPQGFAELARVRLVAPARTDGGVELPVGAWPRGEGYEVDFEAGLATVEAAHLAAIA